MKTVLFPNFERGRGDQVDWLDSRFSFSFANWYNPEKMGFGALRVLNDDTISPDSGFGFHPHQNMEIVTIPLSGILAHQDSLGTKGEIVAGEVQIMSAGTGIVHSEINPSKTDSVKLFQIWVMPREYNIPPRYDQKKFDSQKRQNNWQLLVSPDKSENTLWINQNAYFSIADLEAEKTLVYDLYEPKTNGLFLFVIEGEVAVEDHKLDFRDAFGVSEIEKIKIKSTKKSKLLAIEVPMRF